MTTARDPSTPGAKIPRARLDEVRGRYLSGQPSLKIQSECAAKWGITQRQVRNYLKRVRAQLAKHATDDLEAVRARSEQLLLETYELSRARQGYTMAGTAYDDPDLKTMATCAYRLAELYGATGAKKLEVSGKDGGPIQTQSRVIVLPALEGAVGGNAG